MGTDSPVKRMTQELPWGFSGQESVCQCREQRFDPWFGKIPHTMGQLESVLRSCGSPQALKPVLRNRRSHRSERASHRNREEPLSATTRESPQQHRPHAAKNQEINLFFLKKMIQVLYSTTDGQRHHK